MIKTALYERETLGFVECLQRYIEPRLVEFGFKRNGTNHYRIDFESPSVELSVWHEMLSFEIYVSFQRKVDDSRRYSTWDLVYFVPELKGRESFFQASTFERIQGWVKEIGEYLAHVPEVLSGEPDAFTRLAETCRIESGLIGKVRSRAEIRIRAGRAWRARDYPLVRTLHESIESDITKSEAWKLDFCRRHGC